MKRTATETAYHEAGHTVISYRLGFEVGLTTIDPKEDGLAGKAVGEAPWADGSRDRDYILALYAGYAAERKYNPAADPAGSGRDTEQATELVAGLVGVSEQLLRDEADALVSQYWPEIEAVAAALVEDVSLDWDEATIICDAVKEEGDWREAIGQLRRLKQASGGTEGNDQ